MVWTSWQGRLDTLPEILAGPILRRVEPDAVTVWVAIRAPRSATLRVFDAGMNQIMAGTRASIQIADNVHVVAVTASVPSSALQPGQIYSYNLHFVAGSGEAPPSAPNLTSAGVLRSAAGIGPQSLAYPGQTLPTFALPPADLNDLRLIHGSCRKPHATGRDALQALDGMIQSTASSATERPHQLYLTGDQIYADDVADALLHMLNDAASALGFADEGLVLARPGQRAQQVKAAGITADDAACKSQLVTFSEYCTMYLFAWSDVLWQGDDFGCSSRSADKKQSEFDRLHVGG